MPLKLLSPRKTGRKFYYVRGVLCGKRYFESTKTKDKVEAEKRKREMEAEIIAEHEGKSERMTFAIASQEYINFKKPSERDENFLQGIVKKIGDKFVDEIVQNDLVKVANDLYSGCLASTKNRSVIRPAAAVLHYAADNRHCAWLRIRTFKEAAPKTRFVTEEVEKAIHMGLRAKGTRWRTNKRLLILWLFKQGGRISEILNVKFEDCDFKKMTVRQHISKSDVYVTLPLDKIICRYLNKFPDKEGYVFIWRTRWGAERWILNLTKRIGVYFTPHMARHTVGKRLNDSGAGLKTIMQKLGQKDPKSAIRYQTTDLETIRKASEVL